MLQQTPKRRVLFVRRFTPVLLAVFGVFSLLVINIQTPKLAQAATSNNLNFQARLQSAAGAIVPDGTYNVEFKLYNAASSSGSSQGSCSGDSNCLWSETRTSANRVTVTNGYLTVSLGSVNAFSNAVQTINWDQQLWLTMRIGGTATTPTWDPEMSPRLQLTSVPYAVTAGKLVTGNGTYSSGLNLVQPTAGNQIFTLPDFAQAGTLTAGIAVVQPTTNFQQTGNINVTGSGTFGTSVYAGGTTGTVLSATALTFGTNNATIGLPSNATGAGYSLSIGAGVATSGNNAGGGISIQAGQASGTGNSGSVQIFGGNASATSGSNAGSITIGGGNAFQNGTNAGNVTISGGLDGAASGSGGGSVTINGGGSSSSTLGSVNIGAANTSGIYLGSTSAATTIATNSKTNLVIGGQQTFTLVAISNVTANTTLPAGSTVDAASGISVNQTATNSGVPYTITLPSPTLGSAVAGKIFYVTNVGSAIFTTQGVNISPNSTATYLWNGTTWTSAGIDGSNNNPNYIQNSNSSNSLQSSASFYISGYGRANSFAADYFGGVTTNDTNFQSSANIIIDSTSTVQTNRAINIGTTNATTVNIGKAGQTTTINGLTTLNTSAAAGTISTNAGGITSTATTLTLQAATNTNITQGSTTLNVNSSGVNINTTLSINNGTTQYEYRNVFQAYQGAVSTGTYEIALPNGWNNALLHFEIRGNDYSGQSAWTVKATGSPRTTGSNWGYPEYEISGGAPFSSVRFGYDSSLGKPVLLLGTTTTSWSFFTLNMDLGVTGPNAANYASGYSGQFLTSEANITTPLAQSIVINSPYIQGGNSFGQTAYIGTTDANSFAIRTGTGGNGSTTRILIDASGNVGIGTNTPVQGSSTLPVLDLAGTITTTGSAGAQRSYINAFQDFKSGTTTGTYELILPTSWSGSSQQLRFIIDGNDNSGTATAWQVIMAATQNSAGSWANSSLEIRGQAPFTSARFAYDTSLSRMVLLLGTPTTSWQGEQVIISSLNVASSTASNLTSWGNKSAYSGVFINQTYETNNITSVNAPTAFQTLYSGTSNGDLSTGAQYTKSYQRNLPTNVGDSIGLGSFTSSLNSNVHLDMSSNALAGARSYIVPITGSVSGGTWKQLVPIGDSGFSGGNDFAVDINQNGSTTVLRLRRLAGSTGGTAQFVMTTEAPNDAWVPDNSGTITTGSTISGYYNKTTLSQAAGGVTIVGDTPTITSSGSLTIQSGNGALNLQASNGSINLLSSLSGASVTGALIVGANSNQGDFVQFTDTFDGTTINTSNWSVTGTNTTQNGSISETGDGSSYTTNGITSTQGYRRSNTLTLTGDVTPGAISASNFAIFGFSSSATTMNYTNMPHAIAFASNNNIQIFENGTLRLTTAANSYPASTTYRARISVSAAGARYYISSNNGNTWTLLYDGTGNAITNSPLFVRLTTKNPNATTLDNVSVSNGQDVLTNGQFYDGSLTLGSGSLNILGGNINLNGSATIANNLIVTGDASTGYSYTKSFTRPVPTNINDEVDLGTLAASYGSVQLSITSTSGGQVFSKQYNVTLRPNATASAWQIVAPTNDAGLSGTNDIALDINSGGGNTTLRVRRVAGSTATNFNVVMTIQSYSTTDPWTLGTNSSTAVAAPTVYYATSVLTQAANIATFQGNVVTNGSLSVGGGGTLSVGGSTVFSSTGVLSTSNSVVTGIYAGITGVGTLGSLNVTGATSTGSLVTNTINATTPTGTIAIDTTGAGTVQLGNTNASAIQIGTGSTTSTAVTIGGTGVTNGTTVKLQGGGNTLQVSQANGVQISGNTSVAGTINSTAGFSYGGTAGIGAGTAVSCTTGGNTVLTNAVIQGGIITSGTCASVGASSVTLQNAYDNSGASPFITLGTAGAPGLLIKDSSAGVGGNLFAIKNNGATSTYFSVTSSAVATTNTFQAPAFDSQGSQLDIGNTNATSINIGSTSNGHIINLGTYTGGQQTVSIGANSTNSSVAITADSAAFNLNNTGATIQTGADNINLFSNGSGNGTIVKSGTNSTTAFQIQNSNGTSGVLLNADTVNNSVTIQTPTNSNTAFQVMNSYGSPIFIVDTSANPSGNILTNGGFESYPAGTPTSANYWVASGTTTAFSRNTNPNFHYGGVASLQLGTNTASTGATYSGTGAFVGTPAVGTYTVSFYALLSSGTASTNSFKALINGGTAVTCSGSTALVTTGFQRVVCNSVTAAAAITSVSIQVVDATARTVYIDAVQVVSGATPTAVAGLGGIQLRGAVVAPVLFQNYSNSTTAFQIQNAAGTSNLFIADTLNNQLSLGAASNGASVLNIGATGTTAFQSTNNIGTSTGATQVINLGSTGSKNAAAGTLVNIQGGTTAGTAVTIQTNGAGGITIDSGTTGAINIGTGANAKTITIGSTSATNTILVGPQASTSTSGVIIGGTTATATPTLLNLAKGSTYAETLTTCGNGGTVNNGAIYYNSTSMSLRGCIATSATTGGWEDIVTTSGLGIIAYGVVPDTGSSNPGDLAAAAGYNSGPCKVYLSATSTVSWNGCTAYSQGRKVIIGTGSATVSSTTSAYQNLCVQSAGAAPTLGTASTTEATAALPTFTVGTPALCLATIKTGTTASTVAAIYDTRVYTTDTKTFATLATTAALGTVVKSNGTLGQYAPITTTSDMALGVLVAYSGTVSTSTPNAVIVTSGPIAIKATAGSVGAVIQSAGNTTPAGYTLTGSALLSSVYTNFGIALNSYSASTTSCTAGAVCNGSLFTTFNNR